MSNRIEGDECAVEDCHRPRKVNHSKQGRYRYCSAHQRRKDRYGEVYADVPVSPVRGGPTSIPELRRQQENKR